MNLSQSTIIFSCIFGTFLASPFSFAKDDDTARVVGVYRESVFAAGSHVQADVDSTNDVFLAGGQIDFTGQTTENAFLAGGELRIERPKARALFLAGGDVRVQGAEVKDVFAVGGNVRLQNTTISDDAILTGGRIEISPDTKIQGASRIYGGEIVHAGNAFGATKIAGQNVTLRGRFDGDVDVQAETLIVDDGAIITGNLGHATQNIVLSPAAEVQGQVSATPLPERTGAAAGVFFGILFFVGVILAPALVVLVFPQRATRNVERIRNGFWESLGKGVLTTFFAPLGLVLLFVTIIGIPVGLFALPFLFAAAFFSWSVGVFAVGDQLRRWIPRLRRTNEPLRPYTKQSQFAWTVVGALAVMIILSVPVIGFILAMMLFFTGVGSFYAPSRRSETSTAPLRQSVPSPV